jgi:hypothetical protein
MELGTLRIQSLFRVRGSRRVDTAHENIIGTGHNGHRKAYPSCFRVTRGNIGKNCNGVSLGITRRLIWKILTR